MAKTLQQLILDSLDVQSIIDDTRSLTVPGQSAPATSQEDQITILGALNSLLGREVRVDLLFNGLYKTPLHYSSATMSQYESLELRNS
ncbi:hypothetical protein H2248_012086 [Termitomyces sp. 'cryptogamus']|nr:hypothetical protein H2248_012086 [Termitomyces sp. 'cryptogamus']